VKGGPTDTVTAIIGDSLRSIHRAGNGRRYAIRPSPMNVDSKAGEIADGFYRANEAATIINHSQRIHTLFKSLLNSGTDATNIGRAVTQEK
jgi:hypothetical protein